VDKSCLYSLNCEARRDGFSKYCSSEFVRRPYPCSFCAEYVVRYRYRSRGYIGHIHVNQNEMCALRWAVATLVPNSVETRSVSCIEKCVHSEYRAHNNRQLAECLVTQSCRDLFLGPLVNVPCRGLPWQRMWRRVTFDRPQVCIMADSTWLVLSSVTCDRKVFVYGAPRYPEDQCFQRYNTLQSKHLCLFTLQNSYTFRQYWLSTSIKWDRHCCVVWDLSISQIFEFKKYVTHVT
jgi:hypothetical protein